MKAEGTSRVTWEIEPVGDSCRLTVTHDQLREGANDAALRRLADDPLRPQDLARDRRAAHHARLAHVHLRARQGARASTPGLPSPPRRPSCRCRSMKTRKTSCSQSSLGFRGGCNRSPVHDSFDDRGTAAAAPGIDSSRASCRSRRRGRASAPLIEGAYTTPFADRDRAEGVAAAEGVVRRVGDLPEDLPVVGSRAAHEPLMISPPTGPSRLPDEVWDPEEVLLGDVDPLAVGRRPPLDPAERRARAGAGLQSISRSRRRAPSICRSSGPRRRRASRSCRCRS